VHHSDDVETLRDDRLGLIAADLDQLGVPTDSERRAGLSCKRRRRHAPKDPSGLVHPPGRGQVRRTTQPTQQVVPV